MLQLAATRRQCESYSNSAGEIDEECDVTKSDVGMEAGVEDEPTDGVNPTGLQLSPPTLFGNDVVPDIQTRDSFDFLLRAGDGDEEEDNDEKEMLRNDPASITTQGVGTKGFITGNTSNEFGGWDLTGSSSFEAYNVDGSADVDDILDGLLFGARGINVLTQNDDFVSKHENEVDSLASSMTEICPAVQETPLAGYKRAFEESVLVEPLLCPHRIPSETSQSMSDTSYNSTDESLSGILSLN